MCPSEGGVDTLYSNIISSLFRVKKKMKRFEKDYEDKFGGTPAVMNKMSHPEYKRMAATVIFLKNNLKRSYFYMYY